MRFRIALYVLAAWSAAASIAIAADPVRITVDASEQYQRIEGFGTCLVAWREDMRELYRSDHFPRFYIETMGLNMLRVNMWGPVMPEPVEDWRDISYERFDEDADGGRARVFIEFGRAIRELDPDAKLIGTVWSPPPWMKVSGELTDDRSAAIRSTSWDYQRDGRAFENRLKDEYYKHFAKWMAEYAKWHAAEGAPLYAVSLGNEVMFTQTFESCVWNARDYARMVRILGETLQEEGLGHLKIFGPETMTSHNYPGGNEPYIEHLMSDPEVAEHFDVFATHGYTDGFERDVSRNSSAAFWEMIDQYDRPYWMTEGGTGGHEWPEPLHGGVVPAIHNAFVAGHASAFVPWPISEGRPSTHGLTVMDTLTKKAHATRHFSKFIEDGAVRVDASPAFGPVNASAYTHPEHGTLTIVLINAGEQERPVRIALKDSPAGDTFEVVRTSAEENFQGVGSAEARDNRLELTMPPRSVVTLHGQP